jgi:hypothetical protein
MPGELLLWWSVLCAAAVLNVFAWSASAWFLGRRAPAFSPEVAQARRRVLWLSAIYVLGCGFRSVLPMIDVPRICLHDTPVSYIAVGRSFATVAELCFAAQWAIVLREAGSNAGGGLATLVARLLVPLVAVAEIFCWGAALTTYNLLHAVENSLWTLAAALAVASFVSLRARFGERHRRVLLAAIACGAAYIAFMTIVDVPMYLARWQADLATGRELLPLGEGLRQILRPCTVARDWAAWREDVPWLTLYFTLAVWVSIALAHLPPFAPASGGPAARRAAEHRAQAAP